MKVKFKNDDVPFGIGKAVRAVSVWKLVPRFFLSTSSSSTASSFLLLVAVVLAANSVDSGSKYKAYKNGYRDERLLELYETHQKLCRVNDTDAGQGVCIFMWDCHRSGGRHLGLCSIDSAIYGSCCSVPTSSPGSGSGSDEHAQAQENEELNMIPVDEVSNTSTESETTTTEATTTARPVSKPPVSVSASPQPLLPATSPATSPDIEIVTEYSEEDEANLGHELSAQSNFVPGQEDAEEDVMPINQNRCGIPLRPSKPGGKKMRIIGGMDAGHFAAWPWMVSVRRSSLFGYSSTHSCGGVLVNEHWIVTAAHCVFALSKSLIRVRLGDFDFSGDMEELPHDERPIEKRVIHPDYNFTSYENDLALLKLQKPIEYSLHISPICLPMTTNDNFVGENGTIMGWGRLSEGGRYAQKLQQVTVPIMSNTDCMNMFKESGRIENIPENFICAGYKQGGKDGCQGDSGGPLQILNQTDQRWLLAGVMSWGVGCGEPNAPGVYTRVTKFTDWILQQIAIN